MIIALGMALSVHYMYSRVAKQGSNVQVSSSLDSAEPVVAHNLFHSASTSMPSEKIKTRLMQVLKNRPNVHELDLYRSTINATDVAEILRAYPRLTSLKLSDSSRRVFAEPGLVDLPNLKSLDLRNTYPRVDLVRSVLRVCTRLEELKGCGHLAEAFTGEGLVELPYLKKLDLASTFPTADGVCSVLRVCTGLEELDLEDCRGSAAGFAREGLADLSNLKRLNLRKANPTVDEIRSVLRVCTHLEELNLEGCSGAAAAFTGEGLVELPHLKKLNLRSTYGSVHAKADELRSMLRVCVNLEELDLGYCSGVVEAFTGGSLPDLPSLKRLKVWYTKPTADQLCSMLRLCTNLEELDLEGCRGSAAVFTEKDLVELPHLKKLNLGSTTATADQLCSVLRVCTGLEELDLSSCFNVVPTLAAMAAFTSVNLKSVPSLKKLKLRDAGATATQVAAMLRLCTNLEELDLECCRDSVAAFTGKGLVNLPHLKKLNLRSTEVTVHQLRAMLRVCTNLEELNLNWCEGLVAAFTGQELVSLPNLKKLELRGAKPTVNQVHSMLRLCKNLEELGLAYCPGAGAAFVSNGAALPSALTKLSLYQSVTQKQFDRIRDLLPGCNINA